MNNRLSRILTRWAKLHPTYGYATLAAGVSMDAGDADALQLPDPAHAGEFLTLPAAIYNDVDDECMVPRYNPSTVPAFAIIPQVTVPVPVAVRRGGVGRGGSKLYEGVQVAYAYLEKDQNELKSRKRGGYALEAMGDSVQGMNDKSASGALAAAPDGPPEGWTNWLRLGDIEVVEVTALEEFRVKLGVGGCDMFGSLIATMTVRRYT